MAIKRIIQLIVVVAIWVASFALTGRVLARSGCASYITVQWADTLSGLAVLCGTSVEAIRAANPGLGYWVYAGQVLCIPTGYTSAPVYYPTYGSTYIVQWGDAPGIIVTTDAKGNVWAEVTIDPLQNGYASGWILVKDNLGGYFTDPQIDR